MQTSAASITKQILLILTGCLIYSIKFLFETQLFKVGVKRQYGKRGSRSDPNAASLLVTKLVYEESLRDTATRAGRRTLK